MKDLLIVIDMQNDFIDGSLGTKEAEEIVPKIYSKCTNYDASNKPIIFTKDTHSTNYLDTFEGVHLPIEHCIKNTDGWEISDVLKEFIEPNDMNVVEKSTFAYMNWPQVISTIKDEKGIKEINSIELCGLCTDICVVSNALVLRGLYQNLEITVDSSCCAGVTPEKHEAALEVLRSCQIEVI